MISAIPKLSKFYFDNLMNPIHKTKTGEHLKLNKDDKEKQQNQNMFWGNDFLKLAKIESESQLKNQFTKWLTGIPKNEEIMFIRMAVRMALDQSREYYGMIEAQRALALSHNDILMVVMMPFWKRWWHMWQLRKMYKIENKQNNKKKKEKVRRINRDKKENENVEK